MKNEKGITLVALVIIICLLFIFSGAAIYTSIKSYKVIDIQKYKVQMQSIQSAVDKFYEEFEVSFEINKDELQSKENIYEKQEYMSHYLENKASSSGITLTTFDKIPTNDWWQNIAPTFDISTGELDISKQYYYMTKEEVEKILGVKDIDISENFIINFEKRYVFSEDYIELDWEGRTEGDALKKIFCLYQLNEEEKVVEFKLSKTDGILDIDIIEKNLNYQIIKIKLLGIESKIKEVYAIEGINDINEITNRLTMETENDLKIQNQEYFTEITGLGTEEVCFKIITEGEYSFIAKDLLDGEYSSQLIVDVKFYEHPVLEDDMIPFEAIDENSGRIFLENRVNNLNDWYDYSKNKYATVVIANLTQNGGNLNEYNKNNAGKIFTINRYDQYVEDINKGTHIVKVWIPKKLWKENNNICSSLYNTDFINKTGVWVTAKWEGGKWVPDERNGSVSIKEFNPEGDKLEIELEAASGYNTYYWAEDGSNIYNPAENGIFTVEYNNDKNISYYAVNSSGKKTSVKTTKLRDLVMLLNLDYNNYQSLLDLEGADITKNDTDKCLTFNGNGGAKTKNKIKFGKEFTIEVVFKSENFGVNNGAHILDARDSNNNGIQPIWVNGNNRTIQFHAANPWYKTKDYNVNKMINYLNVFQLTIDSKGSIIARLNGELINTDNTSTVKLSEDFEKFLYIGNKYNGDYKFIGNIYNVKIYKRILSDDELEQNYINNLKKYDLKRYKLLYENTYINDDDLLLHYNGIVRGNSYKYWKDISGNDNNGIFVKDHNNTMTEEYTWKNTSLDTKGNAAIVTQNLVKLENNFTTEITLKSSNLNNKWLFDARTSDNSELGYQPMYHYSGR